MTDEQLKIIIWASRGVLIGAVLELFVLYLTGHIK